MQHPKVIQLKPKSPQGSVTTQVVAEISGKVANFIGQQCAEATKDMSDEEFARLVRSVAYSVNHLFATAPNIFRV